MASERAVQAMERIERAIGRIEAAAAAQRAEPGDNGELERLRTAHQALRGQVEGAIAQLDRLLADGGDV